MNIEHWGKITDRGIPKYLEEDLSKCCLVLHQHHTDGCEWSRDSVVGTNRRVRARATARPGYGKHWHQQVYNGGNRDKNFYLKNINLFSVSDGKSRKLETPSVKTGEGFEQKSESCTFRFQKNWVKWTLHKMLSQFITTQIHKDFNFYVLLAVHLSTFISVINQLDAQVG